MVENISGEVIGCGVMIIKDGQILLGKRTDGQGWCCAGGKVEQGEELIDCAIRETKEEFGIDVFPIHMEYIGMVHSKAKVHGVLRHTASNMYVTSVFDGVTTPKLDEMEAIRWFDLKTLDESILFEPTREAIGLWNHLRLVKEKYK